MENHRLVRAGALCALLGALTSGPLGLWLVHATHPQPPWRDAVTFTASYHWIQAVPFFAGFALVGGAVLLISALHALAPTILRARTTSAVAFVSAFAAMIFTNYAIQTTFVPMLVNSSSAGRSELLAALTMANPRSLGWAIEMWGYAILGVATWLAAPMFGGSAVAEWTSRLFVWNGPASIASALMTAISPGWVLTSLGLWAFGTWNLLIVLLTLGAFLAAPHAREVEQPSDH